MMDFREAFYDAVFDNASGTAQFLEGQSKEHMHAQLPDRLDLWEKLQPNYSIGCKRVIITDDYFPVFLRDNVKLETGKIDKITANGIVTDGKEEQYDAIVLATGFRTVEFMHPIDITGSAGRSLASIWKEGGQALYGLTVESLPNFGMLYGPNTNLGHNSIILMIEAQSKYVGELIKQVIDARSNGGGLVILPKTKRVQEYNDEIQSELNQSSFADPNCNSWYKVKESGKITNNWSRTVIDYQKLMSNVDWSDYDLSGSAAGMVASKKQTHIGRVVEESQVSYQTMALTALSVAAVGAGVALRRTGRLRIR